MSSVRQTLPSVDMAMVFCYSVPGQGEAFIMGESGACVGWPEESLCGRSLNCVQEARGLMLNVHGN